MRVRAVAVAAGISALILSGCSTVTGDGRADEGGGGSGGASATDVSIVVPADPGGGWDQTGRAMSELLTGEGIVDSAPVTNVTGAGGTVGLAELANETDPYTLMVMGLVMVGAVETNAAAVRIEDTTPIARLTEEPLVVVVPEASEHQTLADLVDDIVDRGQSFTVTGGSAGGADHILAGLLLESAGLDGGEITEKLNYIPNSGGGEAVTLLLGGQVSAGISGVGEFAEQIAAGELRPLAVSSEEPAGALPETPTLIDEGYDVTLTNWRGVVAPGGIDDEERAELERVVTELHDSESWADELETRSWTDAFLTGEEFGDFLDGNIDEVTETLRNIGLVA